MQYMKLTEKEKARHPSIHYTGSVRGMKKLGFWGKSDLCVRCAQYIYNLSVVIGGPVDLELNRRDDTYVTVGQ